MLSSSGFRCFSLVPALSRPAGQIQLILGPMFSGKTTELVRRVRRYDIAKHKCLVVKYSKDTRYDDQLLATHDKLTYSAVSTSRLLDISETARQHDVIGVDEGQFFPDLAEFCEDLATNCNRTVIVAALDGTFQRKMFESVTELVPLAESVIKLESVCSNCGQDAPFSRRLSNETELEVIGGADKYMAVCRRCYVMPVADLKSSTT